MNTEKFKTDNCKTLYPNLVSLVAYHSYGLPTFADHANITSDLLEAALFYGEPLSIGELNGIARLTNTPLGMLMQPDMKYLYRRKFQHWQKVQDLIESFNRISELRNRAGNGRDSNLVDAYKALQSLIDAFNDGKCQYCMYRAVLDRVDWNWWLYYHSDKARKPRELKKAPATDQSTHGANKTTTSL